MSTSKWGLVKLFFLVYISAIFLSGLYNPFSTYIAYLSGVLFAVASLYAANFKITLFLRNQAWLAYCLFSIFAIISLPLAIDPETSIRHVRQAVLITFITAGLLLYLSNGERWIEATRMFVVIAGFFGFVVFVSKLLEGDLSRSYLLGSPNSVGLYFAIGSVLGLYLICREQSRPFFLVFLFLIALGLVSVQSVRAILLMLIAISTATAFAIIAEGTKTIISQSVSRRVPQIIFASAVIAVVVMCSSSMVMKSEETLLTKTIANFQDKLLDTDSRAIKVRLELAESGYRLAKECLPFGCGLEYSRTHFEETMGTRTYTHNNYLEILIGLGLPGLIFFTILFSSISIRCIYMALMYREYSQFMLLGGVVGLSVIGLTHNLYTAPIAIIFLIFVGSYSSEKKVG